MLAVLEQHEPCRNDAVQSVVTIGTQSRLDKDRGLHMELPLAVTMPTLLRVTADAAQANGLMVAIEHKEQQQFKPWRVLSPVAARALAAQIDRVLLQLWLQLASGTSGDS